MQQGLNLKVLWFVLLVTGTQMLQAQKNVIKANRAETNKTIDGNTIDWKQPFKNADDDTRLQFSFANDSAFLYICLTTDEQLTQNKIALAGTYIWIDASGRKVQNAGLEFPVPTAAHSGPPQFEGGAPDQNFSVEKMQQEMLRGFKNIKIIGLGGETKANIPLKNQYGIEAAIHWDTAVMNLEYKIPLNAFIHTRDSSKPILICIEIPALNVSMPFGNMPPPDGMGGPPPGMAGETGEGPGVEGMGGPPPLPTEGNFNEMGKTNTIWLKVKLASD